MHILHFNVNVHLKKKEKNTESSKQCSHKKYACDILITFKFCGKNAICLCNM